MLGSAVATIVWSTEARNIGRQIDGNTLKNCARVNPSSGVGTAATASGADIELPT